MAQQLPENLFCLMGLHVGGDFGPFTFYKSKRGKLVWFPKAPPTVPPSYMQTSRRNWFRLAAMAWRHLTQDERDQYELATRRASLCMTGCNLFFHFVTTNDPETKKTLEHQTNTVLA